MKNIIVPQVRDGKFTLIAEAGVNYYDIAVKQGCSPFEAAKLMIDKASAAGVHAVKFQSYKAETLVTRTAKSYWDTSQETATSQFELFKKFDSFGEREYGALADYCDEKGVEFLSTPFDFQSADYLDSMMNVYKISSSDLSNLPFIEHMARKNKPIALSTGASVKDEIDAAFQTIRKHTDADIILMHCVLEYPTPFKDANLRRISALKSAYPNIAIGYSDHTRPDECYDVIKTAYILGATVIEKHYTLDKTLVGNDHYHAMDADDASRILSGVRFIDEILGIGNMDYGKSEEISRSNARRSIISAKDLAAGHIVQADDLTFKRPGIGISPNKLAEVIGKRCAVNIPQDSVLSWNLFEV